MINGKIKGDPFAGKYSLKDFSVIFINYLNIFLIAKIKFKKLSLLPLFRNIGQCRVVN